MPDSVAKRRWDAEHTAAITLKLNTRTDADILSALDGKARQTEIKRLLRAALAAEAAPRTDHHQKGRINMKYTHKLFEDNAGSLHLAVFDETDACVYYLCDRNRRLVLDALAELKSGGDPIADDWEGGEADPAACCAEIASWAERRDGSAREVDGDVC